MAESDADLLARVMARDEEAFAALYARHAEAVGAIAAGILRDPEAVADVAQETFLRVWTHAAQWRGQGSPRSWLLRMATNLALNHLRAARRRRRQPLNEADGMVAEGLACPLAAALAAERGQRLENLLAILPPEKRAVWRRVHEDECELKDVAAELGIPLGTVKSRLHHAARALRAKVATDSFWEES